MNLIGVYPSMVFRFWNLLVPVSRRDYYFPVFEYYFLG